MPDRCCPACGGRLDEYQAVPEFDRCEECGDEWPVDPEETPMPDSVIWMEVARAQRSNLHARTWVHVPADGADQMGFLDAGPLRVVQAAMERTYGAVGSRLRWRREDPDIRVLVASEAPDA